MKWPSWKWAQSVAVDLGSSSTLIYRKGRGIVLCEPSVVALGGPGGRTVIAAGREAERMAGRTRPEVRVVWPVRLGVVVDTDAAALMVQALLRRALGIGRVDQVLISVPRDVSIVEEAAFRQTAEGLGARDVRLVYEPVAAAIGAGLDVLRPRGRLLVDIGSGITEAVVISLGQVVAYHSVRKAGEALSEQLVEHVRAARGLRIGLEMAEQLKRAIGTGGHSPGEQGIPVRGQWVVTRTPGEALVCPAELGPVFSAMTELVLDCIVSVLGRVDPALVTDIAEDGVWVSGGSLLVPGLLERLSQRLGMAVHRVPDPLGAVAIGNGRLLESEELYRAVS